MAFIDFVKWTPGSELTFAWKFPQTNLSTYTQLIVAESQEAILFSKGQIMAKFGPGKHTLNTENLPILRSLFGIPFGGNNPFTAEVWFVNKLLPLNIDWATDSMMFYDPEYQTMVPLVANGRYGLKIIDAERFLIKWVGTATSFTAKELTNNFWGELVAKTKSTLLQFMQSQKIGINTIGAYLDYLSQNLKTSMLVFWEDYGFNLVSFYITSIEVDSSSETGSRILDAMSKKSAQAIAGYSWQQSQVLNIADKAVDSLGQGGGGGGGLIGAVLATNMMNNLSTGGLFQPPVPNQANTPGNQQGPVPNLVTSNKEVYCSNCSKKFSANMKFCPHCGDPYCPCPRCGADNDKNAKRCVSCGTALNASGQVCTGCSQTITPGSVYCQNCGKAVAGEGTNCKRCGTALNNSPFCPQCGLKNT